MKADGANKYRSKQGDVTPADVEISTEAAPRIHAKKFNGEAWLTVTFVDKPTRGDKKGKRAKAKSHKFENGRIEHHDGNRLHLISEALD